MAVSLHGNKQIDSLEVIQVNYLIYIYFVTQPSVKFVVILMQTYIYLQMTRNSVGTSRTSRTMSDCKQH